MSAISSNLKSLAFPKTSHRILHSNVKILWNKQKDKICFIKILHRNCSYIGHGLTLEQANFMAFEQVMRHMCINIVKNNQTSNGSNTIISVIQFAIFKLLEHWTQNGFNLPKNVFNQKGISKNGNDKIFGRSEEKRENFRLKRSLPPRLASTCSEGNIGLKFKVLYKSHNKKMMRLEKKFVSRLRDRKRK